VLVEDVVRISKAARSAIWSQLGGYTMSVAMTNCGRFGWVSDRATKL
jgi:alkylated DNA repair dioxygenase AlkB